MNFKQINQVAAIEFEAAMKIYTDSFPLSERHQVGVIRDRVDKGLSKLFVGSLDNQVVFMALLWPLKDMDFILFDYMATKHGYRGRGIASGFLQAMHDMLKEQHKYFILEVENPKYGDNRRERDERKSFYKHNGVKELKNVRYLLPPLDGITPTEMILMIFPEYNNGLIEGSKVKRMIIQLYRDVYGRDANDVLLNSFINMIGDNVDLI